MEGGLFSWAYKKRGMVEFRMEGGLSYWAWQNEWGSKPLDEGQTDPSPEPKKMNGTVNP